MDHLLTKKELADRLRVSVRTVEYIMSSRQIEYVKVGGSRRIESAEAERYISANRVPKIK